MARKLKKIIVPDEQGNLVEYEVDGVDASTASAGQVPIADGAGDWQWGDVESGDSVPTEVRQAILALFQNGVYARDDMSDEVAIIQSWATEITAISVNPATLQINGMTQETIVATTTPAGGTVTWSSSDETVATVSGGVVTSTGINGTCTITASCGGKRATCAVTVSGFATLLSIEATYTQSGTVYDTDTLDSLKSDLVVTASYDDSTTATVTGYTLSGTLTEGTSTITVTYGGKTTTFNVTVSSFLPSGYKAIEYIKATGTQYLVTDLQISTSTDSSVDNSISYYTCEVSCSADASVEGVSNSIVMGVTSAYGRWFGYVTSVNAIGLGDGTGEYFANGQAGDRHTYSLAITGTRTATLTRDNSDSATKTATANSVVTGLSLFNAYSSTARAYNFPFNGKIYSATVYRDGEAVMNLIPCKRISDNEIGMYDIVNSKFYTNSGTGAFEGGAEL